LFHQNDETGEDIVHIMTQEGKLDHEKTTKFNLEQPKVKVLAPAVKCRHLGLFLTSDRKFTMLAFLCSFFVQPSLSFCEGPYQRENVF
jgi:hypothetical protein